MAESYLFNPSEGINKAASQMQASLGNIFTGIIAQKQNDYNLAEKTFENINALTDKLGEYGQQEITSKTTSLLDDAAKSIIKKGKLDYSEVGRIRNGVNAIKNRKSAIEAGTQMYKEMAQTALATKDDLLNLGTTLDGMRSVILNPENLSAEDMGRQMQSVYQKNINTTKVMTDVLGRIAPKGEFAQTYTGEDGGQYTVAGTKVTGWEYDPKSKQWKAPASVPVKDANGNAVLNPDGTPKTQSYLESITNAVKQQGAPAIAAIRAQMGENSVFQTDEQIVNSYLQQYIQGNNIAQKDIQVKSKDELTRQTQEVQLGAKQLANFDTRAAEESALNKANIRRINVATNKDLQEMEMMKGGVGSGTVDVNAETNTKTGFLGKRIPLSAKGEDGKAVNMAVNSIEWQNGKQYYVGYQLPKSMGYAELAQASLTGMPEVRVPVNSYNKTQLNANIGTAPKKDIPLIRRSISQYENTPMEVKVIKSLGTTAQQARAKKEGRQIFSLSQARDKFGSQVANMNDAELTKALDESARAQGIKALIIK